MKSVGEVMAIGRTFQESLQKALRGLEVGSAGFESQLDLAAEETPARIRRELTTPGAERIWYVGDAFRLGMTVEEVFEASKIDPWFLEQIQELITLEQKVRAVKLSELTADDLHLLKRKGFSDKRLS